MEKDRTVQNTEDIAFTKVTWGQTKELVGRFCVAQSDNVLLKITEYLPHFEHSTHVHPEQEEIIFVLSGNAVSETATAALTCIPATWPMCRPEWCTRPITPMTSRAAA